MSEDIKVLIIEDDPMVSYINRQYTEKVPGFVVIGEIDFDNENELSKEDLERADLLLLDIYLPGKDGITILKEIREGNEDVDVIIISAAKDVERINDAMKWGVVDYLIKPFVFERFETSLLKYKAIKKRMEQKLKFKQKEIDDLMGKDFVIDYFNNKDTNIQMDRPKLRDISFIPKGLNNTTLNKIESFMNVTNEEVTTNEISQKLNISRVTAQRYLKYMSDEDIVSVRKKYGTVGRPKHYYQLLRNDK